MGTSLNSMLGDFRGKIGGVVGSRNASKAFIRTRVKPTNPKSDAQKAARSAFRGAGKFFGTITDEQRAQWQTFALAGYNPLQKANLGNYTASQVITAIMASVASSNALFAAPAVTAFGNPGTLLSLSTSLMSINVDAPLFSVAPNVLDTSDGPASWTCLGAWLEADGTLTMDVTMDGLAGAGLGQNLMKDMNSLRFGFGLYISSQIKYANQRPATAMQSNLGFTGILDMLTPGLTGKHGIRIEMDVSAQLARYKKYPVLNSWFKATPILIAENGTQTKLNSVDIQFGTVPPTIPI